MDKLKKTTHRKKPKQVCFNFSFSIHLIYQQPLHLVKSYISIHQSKPTRMNAASMIFCDYQVTRRTQYLSVKIQIKGNIYGPRHLFRYSKYVNIAWVQTWTSTVGRKLISYGMNKVDHNSTAYIHNRNNVSINTRMSWTLLQFIAPLTDSTP